MQMREERLAEVLGVEPEAKFMFFGRMYFVGADGYIHAEDGAEVSVMILCDMIKNPDRVYPLPRLTGRERAVSTALGARWISRNNEEQKVSLWKVEPNFDEDVGFYVTSDEYLLAHVYGSTFSLRPGQKMELEPVRMADEEGDGDEV